MYQYIVAVRCHIDKLLQNIFHLLEDSLITLNTFKPLKIIIACTNASESLSAAKAKFVLL
jgi:hypothetical protein